MAKSPYYLGVCIKQALRKNKHHRYICFIDTKTKADIFTATKTFNFLIVTVTVNRGRSGKLRKGRKNFGEGTHNTAPIANPQHMSILVVIAHYHAKCGSIQFFLIQEKGRGGHGPLSPPLLLFLLDFPW